MRVRIVGIKQYEDRLGKIRRYYRRKGAPSVAIDPKLTGAALAAEVARLDKKYLTPKSKAGTLRLLISEYKANSDHWRGLRARTRKDYERVFAWLGIGLEVAAAEITTADVAATRDKARDEHEPKFANQVVTTLKMVFAYGREQAVMDGNPAVGVRKAVRDAEWVSTRGNRPCQPWEAANLLDHAPARLLPGIATALYGCLREGDVVALTKAARKGDWITTVQGKTRRPVTFYVCDDYAAILKTIPANDAVTICVKEDGTPWKLEGWKTAWDRYRNDMVKRGLINRGVTFHGLRHTGPTILENAGYDEMQTKHLLGHGPKSVSGHYGMTAERKNLLREMALVVQEAFREGRGNVVGIKNEVSNSGR